MAEAELPLPARIQGESGETVTMYPPEGFTPISSLPRIDPAEVFPAAGKHESINPAPCEQRVVLALDDADLREYGEGLGVDAEPDSDLLWVVQEAFNAPLPTSWSEHTDDEGRVYFFHTLSGESAWEHPMDAVYRELIGLVKLPRWTELPMPTEAERGVFVRDHLGQVHQRALEAIEGWSGPYSSEVGEFYYSEALKVSTWECPIAEWEHELVLRHHVLCRCLLPERTVVGADGSVEPLPAPGVETSGSDLLAALQLPLGLVKRVVDDLQPETPSSRSFHTARSCASTTRSLHSNRSGEKSSARERSNRTSDQARSSPKLSSALEEPPRQASGVAESMEFSFATSNQIKLPTVSITTLPEKDNR